MKPRKTEHPILFSTPMVQAILALIKFMTRRIKGLEIVNQNPDDWNFHPGKVFDLTDNNTLCYHFYKPAVQESSIYIKCPYGQPGDKLWVRETWGLDYFGSGQFWHVKNGIELKQKDILYKADDENRDTEFLLNKGWKPSIHMPKAAARIWLEITDVRVERLKDITEEDAIKEGVSKHNTGESYLDYVAQKHNTTQFIYHFHKAFYSFKSLWDLIHNGDPAFKKSTWRDNPWVWVIEFKRIENSTSKVLISAQENPVPEEELFNRTTSGTNAD